MAKKKKQQKAGLAKKQQAKANKRKQVKRKQALENKPQPQMKMSKVKKTLKNLPVLIFEPELEALAFSPEQIEKAVAGAEKAPDQVELAADAAYLAAFKAALVALNQRLQAEKKADKLMMVQAMLYYMDQEGAPAYMNQLVVGLFLKAQREMKGEEVKFEQIMSMIREYDRLWSEYMENKAQDFTRAMQERQAQAMAQAQDQAPAEDDDEEEESDEEPSLFDDLLEEFVEYLESQGLSEEAAERMQEDAEALLGDFAAEKEITSLEQLGKRKLGSFLTWFERTMAPTEEDKKSMRASLVQLFGFLGQAGKITPEQKEEVLASLAE